MPAGMSREQLTEAMGKLTELRKRYERDHLPFDVYALGIDAFTADGVRYLHDLGVTHAAGGFSSFNPYGVEADTESLQDKIDALNRYRDNVIAKVEDLIH
jgi:hypothetical protein